MQLLSNTPQELPDASVATIGFFDGVHLGHRYLIEQVLQEAATRGIASTVVTFPVNPRKVLQPEFGTQLLTTPTEKTTLLAQTGIDYCIMLHFNTQMSQLSAKEFMMHLRHYYNIRVLVVGYDHRFGCNRSESFDNYLQYGQELGMEVIKAHPYTNNNEAVSSSAIRRMLAESNVSEAAACLGYNYFINGTVVSGYRVGRKIGFPTANIRVDDADKLVPPDGVYAVRVVVDGIEYGGMLGIGYRPTLSNGENRSIEVNIFHFHSDIYDQHIQLSFVKYLRPDIKFHSVDQLVDQLHRDAQDAARYL